MLQFLWLQIPVVNDVLSSHEQGIYPPTSFDDNSIEIKFETDRNFYVDLRQTYLALKIKLVNGRCFDTYKTREKKKEHQEDTVSTETGDDDVEFMEEGKGGPRITQVNNILPSVFFLMQKCSLKTTKSTFRTDLMLTNLTFATISNVYRQITSESCIVKGMTMKKIQRMSSKFHFSLEESNCTVDLTILCCTVSSASTFLQLRNKYIQF